MKARSDAITRRFLEGTLRKPSLSVTEAYVAARGRAWRALKIRAVPVGRDAAGTSWERTQEDL
jgi:hypothetical protein